MHCGVKCNSTKARCCQEVSPFLAVVVVAVAVIVGCKANKQQLCCCCRPPIPIAHNCQFQFQISIAHFALCVCATCEEISALPLPPSCWAFISNFITTFSSVAELLVCAPVELSPLACSLIQIDINVVHMQRNVNKCMLLLLLMEIQFLKNV